MLFGTRGARKDQPARKPAKYRPLAENLEAKILLAIDLGGTAAPALPNIANANVGIAMVGTAAPQGQGAGFSVANLGNINGTGFDSFLIGAPTATAGGALGPGTNSAVYLVFGSQAQGTSGVTTVDWLTNTPDGRVGDLASLGGNLQTNPINGAQGYPFAGVTFVASQQTNGQLGAAVADAGTIRGTPAFLIGAPNAAQAGSSTSGIGTGRAYLVYGSNNLNALSGRTIDLDDPASAAAAGLTIVTFVSSSVGSQLGRSLAGIGNFLNDGSNGIALGAPSASIGGVATSGAVYVMTGNNLPTQPTTIDVTTIGQSGGVAGLVLAGPSGGSLTGFSVGFGGDVNGDGLGDILVGAPGTQGRQGTAFLVYGGNLGGLATTTNAQTFISLARVGTPSGTTPAPVPGAQINGATPSGTAGFAVSGAGDFNNDGFSDIMVGAPGFAASAGRVTLFYGGANNLVNGIFNLDTIPSSINSLMFVGTAPGDLAGYSLSSVAAVNASQPNGILIGSPGYLSDRGAAYYLPGHGGLYTGLFSLSDAENPATLAGLQMTATTPGAPLATAPPFFGASVSGRTLTTGQRFTADSDLLGDFIIGAPGFSATSSAVLAGAGLIVEGARISVGVPPATNVITTTIVQIDSSTTSPFAVNRTTPNAMTIVVTSATAPNGATFNPATDIDPTTITVNGVAFPNATVTANPANANQAIITISPRSSLNLPAGTSTLTVSGRTLATAPASNQPWTASATINTGGGGGGGGGGGAGGVTAPVQPGAVSTPILTSHFGGAFTPTIAEMSRLNYAPIPLRVALEQYLPPAGFRRRIMAYHGIKVPARQQFLSTHDDRGSGVGTLGRSVFTRGQFHPGQAKQWVHPTRVVPVQLQAQKFANRQIRFPGQRI